MSANPLVAQRHDSTTWHTGIGIADDVAGIHDGVESGSWLEGGLGLLGTGLDMLSLVTDPIGTLVQYGVSWLIEHVKPLQEALNWLAGDSDQIAAYAQTWKNVSQAVGQAAQDFLTEVKNGTAGWTGTAADDYRATASGQAAHLTAAGKAAETIGTMVEVVGALVGTVRGIVRDLVAECVSTLIVRVAEWAAEEVGTLGIATPWVVSQAVALIAKWVNKISSVIKKLTSSLRKLETLISKLKNLWAAIKKGLSGEHAATSGAHGGVHDGVHDVPAPHDPNLSTHPASADAPTSPASASAPTHDAPTAHDGSPATTPAGATPEGSSPVPATTPSGSTAPASPGPHGTPDGSIREHVNEPREKAVPENRRTRCGDPIDVATTEMVLNQTDVELAGVLPLVLARTHVSSYRVGRWFGPSWSSTLDQRLEVDAAGVCYATPDGMLLVYPTASAATSVLPVEGPRWPLTGTDDGGYTISDPELGHTLHFAAGGGTLRRLTAITDRNDHRVDLDYDEAGTLTQLRHSGGYRIGVETAGGLITALRLLGADRDDDLVLVRYGYDDSRRLTEVVNSSGVPLRFDYDTAGRITRWQDRNGAWYRYTYDEQGRCVRTAGSGGSLDYRFGYDRDTWVTVVTDSLGHARTFQFNELGQTVRETDPLGHATAFEWDRYDRLLSRTDALGRTTRYDYDESGNLVTLHRADGTQARASYDELGKPITLVDPDGTVWRQEFDAGGNRIALVDPAGARTTFGYDSRGGLTSVVDALGHRQVIETNAAGLPVAATDPTGATTRYERDLFGRITAITDPLGGVTRLGWTTEGRLASRVLPDGAAESWSYDGEGNLVEYRDAAGGLTRTEYTHFDLPAARTTPDGARLQFGYDTELRLVAATNPQGLVWRYDYDPAGRLVAETDFNGRTLRYSYDPAGQLVERVNGAGERVRYRRDALGAVVEQRAGTGDGPEAVTTFSHDAMGRLVGAVGPDCSLSYQRDLLGRALTETVNGRSVASRYDAAGQRVERRTPSGAVSTWAYDPAGRPMSLSTAGRTVRFEHDAAGRERRRLLGPGVVLAQEWDANHRLSAQTLSAPAGAATHRVLQRRGYTYRADGYLSTVDDQLAGPRRFDLDPAGRVTGVAGPGWVERYAYDAAGNVTGAQWPAGRYPEAVGERAYTGMLISRAGRIHYEHDAQGRIVLRRRSTLSGRREVWRYGWDAEDRLRWMVTPDGAQWRYRYDPLGRRIAKERLDADGASVLERVDFTWDGNVLAEQATADPALASVRSVSWDYDVDGVRPVAQTERTEWRDAPQPWVDERFYAIVTDLVGTPSELVDPNGGLAWHAISTVWGKLAYRSSGAYTPLRFPGQYYDPETGLNYNYFRYYDPDTGRYTSTDPLGLAPAPNPNTYVHNPHTWTDPLGLKCEPSRSAAFREAKQDLGIPRSQTPEVHRVPMTDRTGRTILDSHGRPIMTREYHYTLEDGREVVIQDHGAGHDFGEGGTGNQGPHFNVRPSENTRTGHVPGTKDHYPFRR